jgi:hypothetical protein
MNARKYLRQLAEFHASVPLMDVLFTTEGMKNTKRGNGNGGLLVPFFMSFASFAVNASWFNFYDTPLS